MRLLAGLCVVMLAACGASRSSRASERHDRAEASPERRRSVQIETSSGPPASGHPLAPLRPSGAQPVLDALERAPGDRAVLASAIAFYARTDAAGMALLWGTMFGAMGAGPDHAEVAQSMRRVLETRITVAGDHISTRLAPGSVPVLVSEGRAGAPVAHIFELRVSVAPVAWSGPTLELDEAAAVITAIAHGGGPGQAGFDEGVELVAWLGAIERAGLLQVFARWILAPAFPEAGAVSDAALASYLASAPFSPTRALLPDALVRFP
ncbi:MAG: hypothetical protein J0L92_27965 [Deltaproteobacteria bacterium]|nr:hypothetical protein [Deltaproteobacteria bacterium]